MTGLFSFLHFNMFVIVFFFVEIEVGSWLVGPISYNEYTRHLVLFCADIFGDPCGL